MNDKMDNNLVKLQKKEDVSFLMKWYGYLFWLVVPTIIGNVMTDETVAEWVPLLGYLGQVVRVCTSLILALALIKLKSYSDKLSFAGWGMVGFAVWSGLEGLWLSKLGIENALFIVSFVVSLTIEYHEYNGHSEVLSFYNMALSEKWKKLWKWEITGMGLVMGALIVVGLISIVGMMMAMVGAVMTLAVRILKWVYLYQTKQFFTEYEMRSGDLCSDGGEA